MDVTSTGNNVSTYGQDFLDGTPAAAPKQQLTSDDFLKLLATQLSYQDPTKPVDDSAFMAQMASFSQLDQMKTLADNITTFTAQQGIASAAQYLGKSVTVAPANSTSTTGVVSGVTIVDGKPMLSINGGSFNATDVTAIQNAASSTGSGASTSTPSTPSSAVSSAPTAPVTPATN